MKDNSGSKIKTMPIVNGIWENDWDPYPTIVRVAMSNGRVVNYYRDISKGPPILKKALDHFDATCQFVKGRDENNEHNKGIDSCHGVAGRPRRRMLRAGASSPETAKGI